MVAFSHPGHLHSSLVTFLKAVSGHVTPVCAPLRGPHVILGTKSKPYALAWRTLQAGPHGHLSNPTFITSCIPPGSSHADLHLHLCPASRVQQPCSRRQELTLAVMLFLWVSQFPPCQHSGLCSKISSESPPLPTFWAPSPTSLLSFLHSPHPYWNAVIIGLLPHRESPSRMSSPGDQGPCPGDLSSAMGRPLSCLQHALYQMSPG